MNGWSYRLSVTLCLLFAAAACAPMHTLHYTGDEATVDYAGNAIHCELVAVTDSLIFIVPLSKTVRSGLYGLHVGAIGEIEVHEYSNPMWIGFYVFEMVIPTVVIAPEVIPEVRYGMIAFTAATGALLILGTSGNPEIEAPLNADRLTELRKYARYPYEISREQLTLLLRSYGQEAPLAYPTPAGSTYGNPLVK